MLAALVLLALIFVALAAIHRMGDGFTRAYARNVDLGVALAAGNRNRLGARVGVPRSNNLCRRDEHAAAVGCPQVLVGVAAHAVGVGHALLIKNVAHFVRLMAIGAGREDVRFFLPKFTADRLAMHLFDFRVG